METGDGPTQPPRPASHINSGEWQSFEVRMRRRRAERLIVRAETALAEGNNDEVREMLEEARRLAPAVPQIEALENALVAAPPPSAVELESSEAAAPLVPIVPTLVQSQPKTAYRAAVAAAALVTIAVSGATAWRLRDVVLEQFTMTKPSAVDVRPAASVPLAAAPAPKSEAPTLPPPRVHVETVEASPVGEYQASEERAFEPPPQPPPVQLALSPRSDSSAIATLGNSLPATARELPVPASLPAPEMPEVPTSGTIADARTAIPPPALDLRPAPRPERTSAETATAVVKTVNVVNDDAAVRGVLNRYAAAYTHLDASAAQEVWPAVNRSALSRAFDGLASQRVSLDKCSIDVKGTTAHATCAGSTTWAPKIGNGGPRTEARNWTFQLAKAGDDWQIVGARVQNTQNK